MHERHEERWNPAFGNVNTTHVLFSLGYSSMVDSILLICSLINLAAAITVSRFSSLVFDLRSARHLSLMIKEAISLKQATLVRPHVSEKYALTKSQLQFLLKIIHRVSS